MTLLPPWMRSWTLAVVVSVLFASSTVVAQGTYYAGIDTASATFVLDLHSLIYPHTKLSYSITAAADIAARDTTNGQKFVDCVYSGHRQVYTPPWTWGTFSREHTWCHSWMPTYSSESGPEYSDLHHLFPTHQNNANGRRSNHPLGVVVNVSYQYLDGKLGTNAAGQVVYEPRDQQKGDAARALFYMATAYHGVNGKDWSLGYLNNVTLPALSEAPQDVELLKQWHVQDPPDERERSRNGSVFALQANRNPFVDHPEYVNVINFTTMTKWSGGPVDTSSSGGGTWGGGTVIPGSAPQGMAVVVNEYMNGADPSAEWVELLVLQEGVDLRGLRVRDHSSSGTAQAAIVFDSVAAWSAVPRGTLIVIHGLNSAAAEDTSLSDRVVSLRMSNSKYFLASSNSFNISGTTDALQVLTASGTHIHSLGHGSAIGTIPIPKGYVAGSSSAGNVVRFSGISDSLGFTNSANAEHSSLNTPGLPNDAAEAQFISTLIGQGGTSDVGETARGTRPTLFHLSEPYPNPFNPATSMEFSAADSGPALLVIYNVIGQMVGTIFRGELEAGRTYTATWDAGNAPSGVYMARLEGGGAVAMRRMMLVR